MKKVIAILVAVILIMAPLSLAFADEEEIVIDQYTVYDGSFQSTVNEWLMKQAIIYTLRAWGIYVDDSDIDAFSAWLEEQILVYLSTQPSYNNFLQWALPWKVYQDYRGIFYGNDSFLEDIQDFADWLTGYQNWSDSSTYHVNQVDYIYDNDGVPWYVMNKTITPVPAEGEHGTLLYYVNYAQTLNLHYEWGSAYINITKAPDGWIKASGKDASGASFSYPQLSKPDSRGWYFGACLYTPGGNNTNVYFGYRFVTDHSENNSYNQLALISTTHISEALDINTDIINIPEEGIDYQPGDGIRIAGDEPSYIVINFPDTISVDNLPAVISPSGTQDPGFKNAFLPIKGFINTFSDGLELMTDIVYHFPTPIISLALAIIGITIIFGALHMFKEH